jgi:polysaccharide export outer membrane protein
MRVSQLISLAGGLREFVNGEEITILREENGKRKPLRFNYEDVQKGRRLEQDVFLQPGDTVLVPE